ncbi:MAG: DUF4494 family protein [Porphyromonas sp.]|nr:DUF4494 family protein [Porphyromonas sp.]
MAYFEAKVSYLRADDVNKTISESYLVKASNLSEAEGIVERECRAFGAVSSITFGKVGVLKSIFIEPKDEASHFYKVRIATQELSEKGKEVEKKYSYLVNAETFGEVRGIIESYMDELLADYRILSISETSILGVLRA